MQMHVRLWSLKYNSGCVTPFPKSEVTSSANSQAGFELYFLSKCFPFLQLLLGVFKSFHIACVPQVCVCVSVCVSLHAADGASEEDKIWGSRPCFYYSSCDHISYISGDISFGEKSILLLKVKHVKQTILVPQHGSSQSSTLKSVSFLWASHLFIYFNQWFIENFICARHWA